MKSKWIKVDNDTDALELPSGVMFRAYFAASGDGDNDYAGSRVAVAIEFVPGIRVQSAVDDEVKFQIGEKG